MNYNSIIPWLSIFLWGIILVLISIFLSLNLRPSEIQDQLLPRPWTWWTWHLLRPWARPCVFNQQSAWFRASLETSFFLLDKSHLKLQCIKGTFLNTNFKYSRFELFWPINFKYFLIFLFLLEKQNFFYVNYNFCGILAIKFNVILIVICIILIFL